MVDHGHQGRVAWQQAHQLCQTLTEKKNNNKFVLKEYVDLKSSKIWGWNLTLGKNIILGHKKMKPCFTDRQTFEVGSLSQDTLF